MRPIRRAALLVAAALLVPAGIPPVRAVDAGPALFIVPVPLAPVHLQGEFPATVAAGETTLEGTLTLLLASDGSLAGSLDMEGESFAVAGVQSFKNGKGSVNLAGTGSAGTFSWKGKVAGNALVGKGKATGSLLPAKGTFTVDLSDADPLTAVLDLEVVLPVTGPISGSGSADVDGGTIPLDVEGALGKGIALYASSAALSWSAKGSTFPIGGWSISWKAAGFGCKAAGKGPVLAPVVVDLLAGVAPYAGAYPAASSVGLPGGGTVDAYPGQAMVFFEPSTTPIAAASVIGAAGGTVLGSIPSLGFYLVSVSPGSEAAFLAAIDGDAGVVRAGPHIAAVRGGTGAGIIDECTGAGSHGSEVRKTFLGEGGRDAFCLNDGDGNSANDDPKGDLTLERLAHYIRYTNGGPVLVNISSYGKGHAGWTEYLEFILSAVAALPEEDRERFVLTICAGNEDLNVTLDLANIRQDPRLADALSRNVIIAGATESAYSGTNRAPGDADLLLIDDATSPAGDVGTSFAAPRALAILQRLVDQLRISPTFALKAAKEAAKRNANHVLVYEEALAVVLELLGESPAGVFPESLAFEAIEDGPPTAPRALLLRNRAGVGKSVVFNLTGAGEWLSVTPGNGSVRAGSAIFLSAKAEPAGLAPGLYEKTLVVKGPKGITYLEVPVTLTVQPPPVYSGGFSTSMGSHTTFAGCTFGLDLNGTLSLRPREGTGGAVLGDGDTDANLGVFVTYTPPYTSCSAYPFTQSGPGDITGTKANLQFQATNGSGAFTLDFTGVWSGNTISGSATWNQRYTADGDFVYKTGTIPNLVLTKEE